MVDLKSDIQKAIMEGLFDNLGTLKTTVTIKNRTGAPSYNPATGANTYTETTRTVSCLLEKYNVNEVDNRNVFLTDRKMLVKEAEKPVAGDVVVINSTEYSIIMIDVDPSESIAEVQIREVQSV